MADLNKAGPSGVKRRKTVKVRNEKNLSVEEFMQFLYNSDSDEDYEDSDVDNFEIENVSEDSSGSDTEDDVLQNELNNTVADNPDVQITDNEWTETTSGMKQIPFTKRSGLLVDSPGDSAYDWFRLLFDDELLNMIVLQTNSYAVEVLSTSKGCDRSRISLWKELTVSELLIFIGLTFHTGTIQLTSIQDYWKKNRLFSTCFSSYMSRDRYLLIMRCLHFAENVKENEPVPVDRLYKVRPLLDHFNNKMKTVYYPGKYLSLDESMILWKGKLVFKQYLPKKRHKYGVKLYMLTEADSTILDIHIYAGAGDATAGKSHTERVVLHLMRNFFDHGHSLHMDNYYNSYNLAKLLLDKNSFCTGTLRKDRKGCPKNVVDAKLKKGQTKSMYLNNVMVGKWRDKRDIIYISTEYKNEMVTVRNRRGDEKIKPLPIIQYNKYMGGVDLQDQMSSYYPPTRKTLRWYKKIGIHLFQLYLPNAHRLYNKYHGNNKMSYYKFRLSILEKLLPEKCQGTAVVTAEVAVTSGVNHTPSKIELHNEHGKTLRKKCRTCNKNKIRKDTIYHCQECPDKPGLCLGKCFREYHVSI
ncbi:piggyBac transposable element-derived protein 4-like [Diabrotica virgifera virgifera]|uniref:PiggyBac transposable element-derived protein 4-like n=1 Tax=Diabrotica virgifera virgifera TaxID=50390 RepID=A0ABM5L1E9_DIAVI|nr:piggyBac transposable element-derived protein 4-like [Diabrotica virgifera virgifera]